LSATVEREPGPTHARDSQTLWTRGLYANFPFLYIPQQRLPAAAAAVTSPAATKARPFFGQSFPTIKPDNVQQVIPGLRENPCGPATPRSAGPSANSRKPVLPSGRPAVRRAVRKMYAASETPHPSDLIQRKRWQPRRESNNPANGELMGANGESSASSRKRVTPHWRASGVNGT